MSLFLYILSLLIVALSVLFFFFLFRKVEGNILPGSSGWPVFGESIRFVSSGPKKFFRERMKKYSPDVFQTTLFGQKMAVFCGQQGNKFVFANEAKALIPWWPVSVRKALFFPEFAESSSHQTFSLIHSVGREILRPEALKHYIPVMDSMAREHVEQEWVGNDVVKAYPASKKYTFKLSCRLFMSVVEAEQVTRMTKYFNLVNHGLFSVPINLPCTAYNKALYGGKLMREELMKIIVQRRKESLGKKSETDGKSDFLSRMLLATDENGEFVSEKEMSNNIVALLFASYEPASSAIAFVLKYLAELPQIYDEVYKEQIEIAKSKTGGELLTWEDIQKMRYSWNVVCETLRIIPPALGGFREVTNDFTYAGSMIPKGSKTLWTVHTTHKNPKFFADPETFDPSRFEGSGPAPFTYVPFGGGSRLCPGKEYARLEILLYLHSIVTRFKLEKVDPQEKIAAQFLSVPMEGLPLRLVRH